MQNLSQKNCTIIVRFSEYAEWNSPYADNTRNETYRIRITVYAEWNTAHAENMRNARKFEYRGESEAKIENTLGS